MTWLKEIPSIIIAWFLRDDNWLRRNWFLTFLALVAWISGYIGKPELKTTVLFVFLVQLNNVLSEYSQHAYTAHVFTKESPNIGLIHLGNSILLTGLMGLYMYMQYLPKL